MTFSEKYPNAKPGDEPQELLVLLESSDFCEVCGVETPWMETEFAVYFCSDECLAEMLEDYSSEVEGFASKEGIRAAELERSVVTHIECCEVCTRQASRDTDEEDQMCPSLTGIINQRYAENDPED